ncbi:MAG: superoxide dismutase [Sphingobacteriales bacterium]|nr:superoxide dismutase [Sphingobacteriales bacterium]
MMIILPELPFEKNALEPVISSKTIEFHYGKHHQAYVTNLNNLIKGTDFENMMLDDIVCKSTGAIFNNAAQVWNHTFYWESFSPDSESIPQGLILEKIILNFGSFDEFRQKFSNACISLFGSGWVWLVQKTDGTLDILQESNAGTPLTKGFTPLLTCDVWEHAYYLDYQNRRADYVSAFWRIVNWDKVNSRLK